jgi:hypothetical protein
MKACSTPNTIHIKISPIPVMAATFSVSFFTAG